MPAHLPAWLLPAGLPTCLGLQADKHVANPASRQLAHSPPEPFCGRGGPSPRCGSACDPRVQPRGAPSCSAAWACPAPSASRLPSSPPARPPFAALACSAASTCATTCCALGPPARRCPSCQSMRSRRRSGWGTRRNRTGPGPLAQQVCGIARRADMRASCACQLCCSRRGGWRMLQPSQGPVQSRAAELLLRRGTRTLLLPASVPLVCSPFPSRAGTRPHGRRSAATLGSSTQRRRRRPACGLGGQGAAAAGAGLQQRRVHPGAEGHRRARGGGGGATVRRLLSARTRAREPLLDVEPCIHSILCDWLARQAFQRRPLNGCCGYRAAASSRATLLLAATHVGHRACRRYICGGRQVPQSKPQASLQEEVLHFAHHTAPRWRVQRLPCGPLWHSRISSKQRSNDDWLWPVLPGQRQSQPGAACLPPAWPCWLACSHRSRRKVMQNKNGACTCCRPLLRPPPVLPVLPSSAT